MSRRGGVGSTGGRQTGSDTCWTTAWPNGRRVLATPERSGVDIVLWVLPPVGLVVGAVVLGLALRRMAPDALAAEVRPSLSLSYEGLDPEYVARVEEDLKEWT